MPTVDAWRTSTGPPRISTSRPTSCWRCPVLGSRSEPFSMRESPTAKERPGTAVLITGATGFVGMELLRRYLESDDRHLHALVRADDDAAATERLRDAIGEM